MKKSTVIRLDAAFNIMTLYNIRHVALQRPPRDRRKRSLVGSMNGHSLPNMLQRAFSLRIGFIRQAGVLLDAGRFKESISRWLRRSRVHELMTMNRFQTWEKVLQTRCSLIIILHNATRAHASRWHRCAITLPFAIHALTICYSLMISIDERFTRRFDKALAARKMLVDIVITSRE